MIAYIILLILGLYFPENVNYNFQTKNRKDTIISNIYKLTPLTIQGFSVSLKNYFLSKISRQRLYIFLTLLGVKNV